MPMEKYIYENTRRYLSSQDSLVILNEYMFFKDKESQEKFIVLQFENNFEETIYAFKIELTQLNHESKAIRKAEYEFNNLNVDANKNFVPFGKIAVDKACESIDVNLIYVRAETGELVNG